MKEFIEFMRIHMAKNVFIKHIALFYVWQLLMADELIKSSIYYIK